MDWTEIRDIVPDMVFDQIPGWNKAVTRVL
jgi:hypothetical protein